MMKDKDGSEYSPLEVGASGEIRTASPSVEQNDTQRRNISVAMCTYNGGAYLSEQLDSIIAQSQPADEIIVCDDRSTDNTWTILEKYRKQFPSLIRLYQNSINLGPAKNFERAIHLCTKGLIALSDQDDVWRYDKLEKMSQKLQSDPHQGLVFSNAERIDADDAPLSDDLWQTMGFDDHAKAEVRRGRALEVVLRKPIVTGCTMMFRAELKEACLPIGEPLMHDHWISLIAAASSRIDFVDEKLVNYRQHTANTVGAAQLSLAQHIEDAQRLGISQCIGDVVGLKKLLERLENAEQDQTSLIRQKIQFLEFRIRLWSGETSRLQKVCSLVREIPRGRYGKWGNGWRTLAKDLARLLSFGEPLK